MKSGLKIALLSGSRMDQGKTSIADNLFMPYLPNPLRFEVEKSSTGSSKSGVQRISPNQLAVLREALMNLADDENLVCDVGGSAYADFMEWLSQFRSTTREFNLLIYVIKIGGIKQADALTALAELFEMSAEPSKVSVVFNGAPYTIGLEALRRNLAVEFAEVFACGKELGFHVCTTPIVYADHLYKTVFHSPDWTIDSLANGPDFRSQIRALKRAGEEIPPALLILEAAQENARSFGKANLDAIREEIMSKHQVEA